MAFGLALIAIVVLAAFTSKTEAAVPSGGRAWELVTFREQTSARTFAVRAMSGDDDKFAYSSFGPAPGSASGPFTTSLIAERGQTGWTNTPISLPYSINEKEFFIAYLMPIFAADFSEDLQTVVWVSSVPLTPDGPPEPELGLYRKAGDGPVEFIADSYGNHLLFLGYEGFAEISSDGSRIIFNSVNHLLPGDGGRTSGASIYEWEGGNLRLVDVDNGGALLSTCGVQISNRNGVSAATDLVFFTVPAACAGVSKVYMRDLENDSTVQISSSQCTRVDCNAAADAAFAGAMADGSAAFFTSKQQLTNDDHDAGRDLYRYDVGSGELALLSGGAETTGEVVSGIAYPSDNGARVYFRGTGEVLPGESTTGEKLFLADSSGVHLVAGASFTFQPEIQLSTNGTRVVFTTKTKLLPSDTDSEFDVYLYDTSQESLTQISTGPSGGNGPFEGLISSPIERPEFQTAGNYQPFYAIDGSGERIFFGTREQLLPEDINTTADVYEWWNGQLGLITSGEDSSDSGFAGVSRDGRTALFVTNASLLPADVDGGNRDFYVARLGGGFPEPEAPPGCDDITLCPSPSREQLRRPTLTSRSPFAEKSGHIRVIRVRSKEGGVVGRSTTVLAEVPRPGLVSVSVWAHEHGRKMVLAAGSSGAVRPGKVRIDLRLTRFGRQPSTARMRKGHLTVSAGGETISQVVKLDLG